MNRSLLVFKVDLLKTQIIAIASPLVCLPPFSLLQFIVHTAMRNKLSKLYAQKSSITFRCLLKKEKKKAEVSIRYQKTCTHVSHQAFHSSVVHFV